jgi:hypothetical protein
VIDVIELTVRYKSPAERTTLVLTLRNAGDRDLTLFNGYLPWRFWHSMTLKAVEDAPGAPCLPGPRLVPIQDPVSATTTIKPGRSVAGQIDLRERFPGIEKALRRTDVIVFWSYQGRVTGPMSATVPLQRVGGWLLVPHR